MGTRTLTNRAVVVSDADVILIDEHEQEPTVPGPSEQSQPERRPLLHHYHRRHGFGFVSHRAPMPKKIVRSDL